MSEIKDIVSILQEIKPDIKKDEKGQIDYEKTLLEKGEPIAYFKTVRSIRGGKRKNIENYYCVWQNGMATYVDTAYWRIKTVTTLAQPYQLLPCTEKEYKDIFDKAVRLLS